MSRFKEAVTSVTWPLWLPIFLIGVGFHHYWFLEHSLRQQLARKGRYIKPARRRSKPAELTGTIIVENAAFNHARVRIWWTEEDALSLCPYCAPTTSERSYDRKQYCWPPFDRWMYQTFLDPTTGRAQLLWTKLKWITDEKIQAKYPKCKFVDVDSGGRQLEDRSGESETCGESTK